MRVLVILCLLLCSSYIKSFAQYFNLQGKVTTSNNLPAAFASIYINHSLAITTNENGDYRVNLKPGSYAITYRYIGCQPQSASIDLTQNSVTHNVKLQASKDSVQSTQQDSAYTYIQKVIDARLYYLNQVTTFSSKVYTKSVQRLLDAPKVFVKKDVAKQLKLNANRRGIINLSETTAEFNFRQPDKIRQVESASKTSGSDNAFDFNTAADMQTNFYQNLLHWDGLTNHEFVSPIADDALHYYQYSLTGKFNDGNYVIDKIKVTPKHKDEHLFTGTIYIIENDWRLYAVDLHLYKMSHIDFIDSIAVKQQYIPVNAGIWMPQVLTFHYNGSLLGFKYGGYVLNIYADYKPDIQFPEHFFNGEILRSGKDVAKKSDQYWDQNRPIVLLPDEERYYHLTAQALKNKKDKSAQDSVQLRNNGFRLLPYLINGYKLNRPEKKASWSFDPPYRMAFYNTIEGWGIDVKPKYVKVYDNQRKLTIVPDARYGFSDKILNTNLYANFEYDPFKRASVYGRIGTDFLDLNDAGTLDLFINSISTLFFSNNYLKLYRSKFVMAGTEREVSNGILLNGQFEYAERSSLFNTSLHAFGKDSTSLTSNNPLDPNGNTLLFPNYRALIFRGTATFTFDQQYTVNAGGKFIEDTKYPRIRINYKKGIPGLGSNVNYDFASVDVFQDKLRMGIYGSSSYFLSAGGFLNSKALYYPDYKQFRGGQSFLFDSTLGSFHFLNYYTYSTYKPYFEAHVEHNFAGYFLSQVPLINRLNMEEIVGGSYLTQGLLTNYEEVYVGLKRTLIRLDYGFAFGKFVKTIQGFRLSYSF